MPLRLCSDLRDVGTASSSTSNRWERYRLHKYSQMRSTGFNSGAWIRLGRLLGWAGVRWRRALPPSAGPSSASRR
jgi:hypothetical protein